MGKRSRQTRAPGASTAEAQERARSRKQVLRERASEATEVAERQIKQRPPAPWDPFPLTELAVFVGLILLVVGAIVGGSTGKGLIAAGVVLACIGGLDTALREHFNGYRPHSGLLAGILAVLALGLTTSLLEIGLAVRAGIAIGVFALAFPALRSSFIRKSGGRGVL